MSIKQTNYNGILRLKSWGTLTGIRKNQAKVSLGGPEIHRLLKLLREAEENKTSAKPEIIDALELLEENYFNNPPKPIEAESPIDKRLDLKQ